MTGKKTLSSEQIKELLSTLQDRFEQNLERHKELDWQKVKVKLEANTNKLWSLNEMEKTGGEPDVIEMDQETGEYLFYDCSPESPKGRRSFCYDQEALDSRKEYKPKNSVIGFAAEMGVELMSEDDYRKLQEFGQFDAKTSSWILTPADIREKGGALFCDYRFGHVFVYHNGAESYYAARGFRAVLKV